MLLNLILDGNYILSKLVFTLHKNNLLYGALYQALENSLKNYQKMYPFHRIYLVSDSKEKSWRKSFDTGYKSTRKKDSDIDWSFVYDTYNKFKEDTTVIKVMESPRIEGDDWIALVCEKTNSLGQSNMIVTNDHDIKQLVRLDLNGGWINFISNEMYNNKNVFMPTNYKLFLSQVRRLPNDDIFNMNDNEEFLRLCDDITKKFKTSEIDWVESLITKIISGDSSDNIKSIYVSRTNTGKLRGIGDKGAQTILENYKKEFGHIDIDDPDMAENIGDIICERKKISKDNIDKISKRVHENRRMVQLKTEFFPPKIKESLEDKWIELNG
jgi:5'-3' exonuclease